MNVADVCRIARKIIIVEMKEFGCDMTVFARSKERVQFGTLTSLVGQILECEELLVPCAQGGMKR
eukprot:768069-Hanusia_phi.AAC.1